MLSEYLSEVWDYVRANAGSGERALSMDFLVFALVIPPSLRLMQMSDVTISLTLRAIDAFSLLPPSFLME